MSSTLYYLSNRHDLDLRHQPEDSLKVSLSSFLDDASSTVQPFQYRDDRPVIPFRSQAQKDFAQRCTRAKRGAVYFKHHRKAGGSSLYSVFQKDVCDHTPVYSSELPYFNMTHSFSALPNSTVFLTTLRHPIDRILSLYWFEGRWPRTCQQACEDKKVKDDTTKVADLNEWIEAVYHQKKLKVFKLRPHTSCGQWQSVENYYVRMLTGVDRAAPVAKGGRGRFFGFANKTLTLDDLHRAKEVLASFDLVLIQERYKDDASMLKMFHTITAARPRKKLLHERRGVERNRSYIPPSPRVLERLYELNRLDLELYEYAKTLSRQTVDRWMQTEKQKSSKNFKKSQCQQPPRMLPNETARIVLGGKRCKNQPLYYYGPKKGKPRCLLHSNSI